MKKALIIIAHKGFQDIEYSKTREQLENANIEVSVASTSEGICTGAFGLEVEPDLILQEVNINDFDAIVFIGGPGTPSVRSSPYSTKIALDAHNAGKIIGAICWSPTILAKAGILDGKRATVWVGYDDEKGMDTNKYLEQQGAEFVREPVVVDGRIVTANGPPAAEMFGKTLAKMITQTQ